MYQKLIVIGNLGCDPELRYTPDGKIVATFSMASTRRAGEKDWTVWYNVSVWGAQAKACSEFLRKGSKVLLEGYLLADESGNPRVYERKDGILASSFDVSAQTVRFLDGKRGGENGDGEPY